LELIGQDPGLVITSDLPNSVSITLSAPRSIWDKMINDKTPVRAVVDLSGIVSGNHTLPIQIQVGISPAKVTSFAPLNINVTLENLLTRSFNVQVLMRGEPAVGFQAESPTLEQTSVTVSGPEQLVSRVQEVRAVLDLTQAKESISRVLSLQALDASEAPISGVTITHERVQVNGPISQRGGFRSLVVKPVVTGMVGNGYRLTNISVFPLLVTVFSTDPTLVEKLPGYVETQPLDLSNAHDDLDKKLALNLPEGISIVGEQTVEVQVGIAAIEGSITLTGMPVEIRGLPAGLSAMVSPVVVDVILSGPLPLLDGLKKENVTVVVDLSTLGRGTFQLQPKVETTIPEIRVESILPGTVEITITSKTSTTPGVIPTP
jgi:YbbR domain-containing protein